MRIMHVLNSNSFSGAENVAVTIINHLEKEGYESIYVSLDGPINNILAQKNIKFFPIKKMNIYYLKKAIKFLRPDVIHAHDFTTSVMAALSEKKIPIISHLHHNAPWIKTRCLKSWIYSKVAKNFSKILLVSMSIYNEYYYKKNISSKILVVSNPIFVKEIKNKVDNIETDKKIDVTFLGRITDAKNPFLFVDIIEKVKERIGSIKVNMIGSGELLDDVKSYISCKNLKDDIKCFGFLENPYTELCKSKILCMPSKWEGFGLVAIESLSFGIPVVCSNVGGLPSIVNDKCGKLCFNFDEYVDEIERLLTDKDYYLNKTKNAFQQAGMLDNGSKYMENIKDIYSNCKCVMELK